MAQKGMGLRLWRAAEAGIALATGGCADRELPLRKTTPWGAALGVPEHRLTPNSPLTRWA